LNILQGEFYLSLNLLETRLSRTISGVETRLDDLFAGRVALRFDPSSLRPSLKRPAADPRSSILSIVRREEEDLESVLIDAQASSVSSSYYSAPADPLFPDLNLDFSGV